MKPVFDATGHGDLKRLRELLDDGTDVDQTITGKTTPLHLATSRNQTAAALLLLDYGASPDLRQKGQQTPLILAAGHGMNGVVKRLLKAGANINHKAHATAGGHCALTAAAERGKLETCRILLVAGAKPDNAKNGNGMAALALAAEQGHPAVVELLLTSGATVNAAPSHGTTALGHAARSGHRNIVEILLAADAGVTDPLPGAQLPLAEACKGSDAAIVRRLIEHGADAAVCKNSTTALGNAVMARRAGFPFHDRREIIRVLIDHGADPNLPDRPQRPLHLAARDDAMTADPEDVAQRAWAVEQLLAAGAAIDVQDPFGATALMYAVETGQEAMATTLLEHGAAVHLQDTHQATALLRLTATSPQRCHPQSRAALTRKLLQRGADPDLANRNGLTPIMAAAFHGPTEVVRRLLEYKADLTPVTSAREDHVLHVLVGGPWGSGANAGSEEDRLQCIAILRAAGADVTQTNNDGETPALLAARLGLVRLAAALDGH